jgi:hypothetical protein
VRDEVVSLLLGKRSVGDLLKELKNRDRRRNHV